MMNARLFGALGMPLVFVMPGLPESQLSAEQDSTTVNVAEGGQMIVFHRAPSNRLWVLHADGTHLAPLAAAASSGNNLLATSWSVSRWAGASGRHLLGTQENK